MHRSFLRLFSSHAPHRSPRNVIYSGIQPTGTLHIGNYFGALVRWLKLQSDVENECIFSIADLHAITLPWEQSKMKESIQRTTATILACGIDPEKCILFQQSDIPHHCNLSWILSCLVTLPKLLGLPQYRDKSAETKSPNPGLLLYPVLQTADIILYKANQVPVGADQLQQIHLCQHLVQKFNSRFGETFPTPTALIDECNGTARIKSLRDPDKKMSKSDANAKSKINLLDSNDDIMMKITKAVTDSTSALSFDPEKRPGVSNLLSIHSAFTGLSIDDILTENAHLDTARYKKVLAQIVIERIEPIRNETIRIMEDKKYIESVLAKGREKALEIAENNMDQVMRKVGFR